MQTMYEFQHNLKLQQSKKVINAMQTMYEFQPAHRRPKQQSSN